jgi:hypothetical protein
MQTSSIQDEYSGRVNKLAKQIEQNNIFRAETARERYLVSIGLRCPSD